VGLVTWEVPSQFRSKSFSLSTNMRKVRHMVWAGGCMLQLRSDRAQLYIPTTLTPSNKGWHNRWFYLCNDDGLLSSYMQRVVFAVAEHWLWDHKLTAARVVVAFHRRRVLPLNERRLHLDDMTLEASVESSRMASAALSNDELLRRVKGMVGKANYTVIIPMCPD
jgi:hypothetical protein